MPVPLRITEIWAWVVTEADGSEGVPASRRLFPGFFIPLMGADEVRIRSLEAEARAIAAAKGLPLKLMRFTGAQVVETRQ